MKWSGDSLAVWSNRLLSDYFCYVTFKLHYVYLSKCSVEDDYISFYWFLPFWIVHEVIILEVKASPITPRAIYWIQNYSYYSFMLHLYWRELHSRSSENRFILHTVLIRYWEIWSSRERDKRGCREGEMIPWYPQMHAVSVFSFQVDGMVRNFVP